MCRAILAAVSGGQAQRGFIPHALWDLANLEPRPACLTEYAYVWCLAIHEHCNFFEDWENLLLVCLELAFRRLDPRASIPTELTYNEDYQELVDVVFKSQNSEAIADLLHSWIATTFTSKFQEGVGICTRLLADFHNLVPLPQRLRLLVIRYVGNVGYEGFEDTGVEKFTELLDHLHPSVEEVGAWGWSSLLLAVILSPEGIQHLSHWYWELLAELTLLQRVSSFRVTNAVGIAKTLIEAREWGKLECWIRAVWVVPSLMHGGEHDLEIAASTEAGITIEGVLEILFQEQPHAAQRLEEWMKRRDTKGGFQISRLFEPIFARAQEAARRQVAP